MGNIRKAAFASPTPVVPKAMRLLDATNTYELLRLDNQYFETVVSSFVRLGNHLPRLFSSMRTVQY